MKKFIIILLLILVPILAIGQDCDCCLKLMNRLKQGGYGVTGGYGQGTASAMSYWTKSGNDLYYNLGNIGIGTSNLSAMFQVGDGSEAMGNPEVRIYGYRTGKGARYGRFIVDTSGNFNINSQQVLILKSASGYELRIGYYNELSISSSGDVVVKSTSELYGQLVYDEIVLPFTDLYNISADTLWFLPNDKHTTVTIDSILVQCGTDDQDLKFVESNYTGGGINVIDNITVSNDGTSRYYTVETTISHATIEERHWFGVVKPTGTSTWMTAVIYVHYVKQKKG